MLYVLHTALEVAGAVAVLFVARAALTLGLALKRSCDSDTARAVLTPQAYAGKVIWITGASSGIGKEMALQVGPLGAKLILTARSVAAMEEVKAQITAAGASPQDVAILPADLASLDELPALAETAIGLFGGVDVFVNNAGFTQREIGANTDFAVDRKMVNVNFLSGGDYCAVRTLRRRPRHPGWALFCSPSDAG